MTRAPHTPAPRRRRPVAKKKPSGLRRLLDQWFATLVRYAGLGLMAYSVFGDHLHRVELVTAAVGMILFKNVWAGDD